MSLGEKKNVSYTEAYSNMAPSKLMNLAQTNNKNAQTSVRFAAETHLISGWMAIFICMNCVRTFLKHPILQTTPRKLVELWRSMRP